jgi:hypothetical protein
VWERAVAYPKVSQPVSDKFRFYFEEVLLAQQAVDS